MNIEPIPYNGGKIYVDKEPLIGDLAYHKFQPHLFHITEANIKIAHDCKKVIAQSPNLSIEGIPYVEVEEDVESAVNNHFKNYWVKEDGAELKGGEISPEMMTSYLCEVSAFIAGYKAASAKGRYTDEDIRKAWNESQKSIRFNAYRDGSEFNSVDDFIQSLQPKIKSIDIEMEDRSDYEGEELWEIMPNLHPITYQKDGKTFLKVKKINYDK